MPPAVRRQRRRCRRPSPVPAGKVSPRSRPVVCPARAVARGCCPVHPGASRTVLALADEACVGPAGRLRTRRGRSRPLAVPCVVVDAMAIETAQGPRAGGDAVGSGEVVEAAVLDFPRAWPRPINPNVRRCPLSTRSRTRLLPGLWVLREDKPPQVLVRGQGTAVGPKPLVHRHPGQGLWLDARTRRGGGLPRPAAARPPAPGAPGLCRGPGGRGHGGVTLGDSGRQASPAARLQRAAFGWEDRAPRRRHEGRQARCSAVRLLRLKEVEVVVVVVVVRAVSEAAVFRPRCLGPACRGGEEGSGIWGERPAAAAGSGLWGPDGEL